MAAGKGRARNHGTTSCGTAGDPELPRPLRLIRTAGWSLAESLGLPVAAYAIAAWLDSRNAAWWPGWRSSG